MAEFLGNSFPFFFLSMVTVQPRLSPNLSLSLFLDHRHIDVPCITCPMLRVDCAMRQMSCNIESKKTVIQTSCPIRKPHSLMLSSSLCILVLGWHCTNNTMFVGLSLTDLDGQCRVVFPQCSSYFVLWHVVCVLSQP